MNTNTHVQLNEKWKQDTNTQQPVPTIGTPNTNIRQRPEEVLESARQNKRKLLFVKKVSDI